MISIPEAFRNYAQFFNWQLVPAANGKKPLKVPVDAMTGRNIDSTDPRNHLAADEALRRADFGFGVAFQFTAQDPFFFLDIDDCLVDGRWSELATSLCQTFQGCYVEISQSGKGLHIFGSGVYPGEHKCRYEKTLEFYTKDRFVALTGTGATGDARFVAQPSIDWLIQTYFNPGQAIEQQVVWSDVPCSEWDGITDDDKLIDKMLASKSAMQAFGGKATVADLWAGDLSFHGGDHSAADAALCQHLAFWTGKNCARIDRLFRRSGLMRDKWDERRGQYQYGVKTILNAVSLCTKVFGEKKTTSEGVREGFQFMSTQKLMDHFKGCYYISDIHKIINPRGRLLAPDQFKVLYGGHVFAIDSIGDKTTDCAYKAFTQNQGYHFPKLDSSVFRPELPEFTVIKNDGLVAINTYVKIETPRRSGDPSRFLKHLEIMIPDAHDRQILLSWAASIVQNPGRKIRWMPVIQGAQGNGKSLLMSVIVRAIGERYCHTVNASDLAGNGLKFNQWLRNKLFVIFEEIYVPRRREVLEAMKPLITETRIEIQGKGEDQVTGDNRANFAALTNHKDGAPKAKGDRRNCIIFTAQQTDEDMIAAGFKDVAGNSTKYFPDLCEWLESEGYEIMTDYLHTYRVESVLDPFTSAVTAPITSSTNEAILASLGGLEQEIQEAIAEGRSGFVFPWISSFALDKMIEGRGEHKKIPRNKRKEILFDLGYILHPCLKGGRVNGVIPSEGGKPRLYVKSNTIQSQINVPATVLADYLKAQSESNEGAAAAFRKVVPNK